MILLHELISDYSAGLEQIHQLENKLQKEWAQRLGIARTSAQEKYRYALQEWDLFERARQVNYQKRMRAWKMKEDEKDQRFQTKKALWQKRENAIQQRYNDRLEHWRAIHRQSANRIWIAAVIVLLLGCTSYSLTPYIPRDKQSLEVLLQIPCFLLPGAFILFGWAVYREYRLKHIGKQELLGRPSFPKPNREPATRGPQLDPPKPRPILEEPLQLGLLKRWLLSINRASFELPEYRPRSTGEGGEEDLFLLLAEKLSDDYFALRNILLRRSLDADLIVIGPTGIWLLDSKYWSGPIRYSPMGWEREKRSPEEIEYPPDLGWGNQKKFTIQALQRTRLNFGWEEIVQGGIAFTHPNYTLEISRSCPIVVDNPEGWAQRIQSEKIIPGFSLEMRLKAADALCKYSSMPRKEQIPNFEPKLSATIADQVFNDVVNEVSLYIKKFDPSP